MAELRRLQIDFDSVAEGLLADGIQQYVETYDALPEAVDIKYGNLADV